ncbi:hypothetical protein Maq22A_1p37885 (plasmid) [Methylobacterium aquaticum]|uniref:Uncharacterized protein n=1 Tax=Methylobacterium aquaticum TaxID=270351 RepID=A0A0C6FRU1_9HYPH|nr:hypothetical protein Maq22A_1p37885 [Methylobacterium aquaticum]
MRRLNADWVTARDSAEREKLRVSARLRKSSIHLSSIALVRVGGEERAPRAASVAAPYGKRPGKAAGRVSGAVTPPAGRVSARARR